MVYQWNPNARMSGDAQEVGEELQRVKGRKKGLDPADVVESARARSSVLHRYFTWNNTEAADLHRLEEARHLVRHVLVVQETPTGEKKTVRAYLHVKNHDNPKYVTVQDALKNPEYRAEVLDRALVQLEGWVKTYEDLTELAGVVKAVRVVRKRMEG